MTLPEDDLYFYGETRNSYYDHTTELISVMCARGCGHVAHLTGAWAPDVRRHWYRCTNQRCRHEWC